MCADLHVPNLCGKHQKPWPDYVNRSGYVHVRTDWFSNPTDTVFIWEASNEMFPNSICYLYICIVWSEFSCFVRSIDESWESVSRTANALISLNKCEGRSHNAFYFIWQHMWDKGLAYICPLLRPMLWLCFCCREISNKWKQKKKRFAFRTRTWP